MLEGMGASDIWKKKGQNILVDWYGGIKVHRGEYDRNLIDVVVNVLESGYPMLIAPEGSRSHTPGMHRAMPGIAFILEIARVPVVPVGVVGTTDDFAKKAFRFRRPSLKLHIGKPFYLPPIEGSGQQRREARQQNADLVMGHIAALLPEEYRGVYADQVIYRVIACRTSTLRVHPHTTTDLMHGGVAFAGCSCMSLSQLWLQSTPSKDLRIFHRPDQFCFATTIST